MVQEAIERYRQEVGNITTITIAHRLSTIRDSDKIVCLVDGVLTETGSHDEILRDFPDGTYAGFVKEQGGAEEKADEDQAENSDEEHKLQEELKSIGGLANAKSGISVKRTMSMRAKVDPREKEMM